MPSLTLTSEGPNVTGKPNMAPRRALAALILCLATIVGAPLPAANSIGYTITTADKLRLDREARLVVDLLQNFHYSGRLFREIDDREILDRYLSELDPGAQFLTRSDAEFIHQRFDRPLKSVYLLRGDLQPAFEIFDLLTDRVQARQQWLEGHLSHPLDFSAADKVEGLGGKAPLVETAELDQRWTRLVKELVLREILAGRSESEGRQEVQRRFREWNHQIIASDVLAVRAHFFDAVIRSYDPHSGYFSADAAREFAETMGGAVFGSGLDVEKKDGRFLVSSVEPGSPADMSGEIFAGDAIEAVADGDQPWRDTAKLRLQEVAALTRGDAGTKLRIAFRPNGEGPRREVTLERAQIIHVSERARGAIATVPAADGTGRRIGWIVLPTFYSAFDDPNGASAARDVRELIDAMKVKKIDGLVLDLRENPGGALPEGLAISGLFSGKARVMLTRTLDGKVEAQSAPDGAAAYDGPLVVLTSAKSASASEVFTGAMKFHRRALVVGEASTFGKGTVQNYVELAKALRTPPPDTHDWGTLRLTAQRFFLPDGGSVQVTGIPSDVVLPGETPDNERREAELPHALPAETVTPPAATSPSKPVLTAGLLARLLEKGAADVANLPEWALARDEDAEEKRYYSADEHSLQLEGRRQEWADARARWEALRLRYRKLAASEAFAVEAVELTAVQDLYRRHDERWHRPAVASSGEGLHHFAHGVYVLETEGGHVRDWPIRTIDFREFSGDCAVLAEEFSRAGQHPATTEEITLTLERLGLLDDWSDASVLGCFPAADSPAGTRRGAEAVLERMATLDGDILKTRPVLDVRLREGLRLAAAWANFMAAASPP